MAHQQISTITLLACLALGMVFNNLAPVAASPPALRTVCGVVADAEEIVGNKALAAGKAAVDLALKPIAIVGGLKAAAVGTGMKIGGGAINFVGTKMAKDGAKLEAAGVGVKGAGLGLAALGLRPAAEKIVAASQVAEVKLNNAAAVADKFAKSVGDTSVQIGAALDSPVLGHHSKEVNITTGLGVALKHSSFGAKTSHNQIEQQHEQQHEQQQEVVSAKSKRAAKIDTEIVKAALNLVKEAKMEDCVARAICDLNCDPQGYGQDGKQVFMNMVRLQGSNSLDQGDSKYFHDAAAKGRSSSGKCNQCTTVYPKCSSKSSDLIKMASHLRLD